MNDCGFVFRKIEEKEFSGFQKGCSRVRLLRGFELDDGFLNVLRNLGV